MTQQIENGVPTWLFLIGSIASEEGIQAAAFQIQQINIGPLIPSELRPKYYDLVPASKKSWFLVNKVKDVGVTELSGVRVPRAYARSIIETVSTSMSGSFRVAVHREVLEKLNADD